MQLSSIESVAHVEVMNGADADTNAPFDLLIEVPHGADERTHYDALFARMKSALPKDLQVFFHVNTDIGAWDYGRKVAELVLAAAPRTRALLIRCLVPRTFVDTNRTLVARDDLAKGGLTGATPPYITDPADHALLNTLHTEYVNLIDAAYASICGAGGMALSPHTYGPYLLPIERIDEHIVDALRAAHEPAMVSTLKVRAEIDLLTDTKEGERLADPVLTDAIAQNLEGAGFQVARNASYCLLPGSQTHRQSVRYPGRVFCLEARRDLLVETYAPLDAMHIDPNEIERLAQPIAVAIHGWLARR
jgi:hypothetical protein